MEVNLGILKFPHVAFDGFTGGISCDLRSTPVITNSSFAALVTASFVVGVADDDGGGAVAVNEISALQANSVNKTTPNLNEDILWVKQSMTSG